VSIYLIYKFLFFTKEIIIIEVLLNILKKILLRTRILKNYYNLIFIELKIIIIKELYLIY